MTIYDWKLDPELYASSSYATCLEEHRRCRDSGVTDLRIVRTIDTCPHVWDEVESRWHHRWTHEPRKIPESVWRWARESSKVEAEADLRHYRALAATGDAQAIAVLAACEPKHSKPPA